MGNVYMEAEQIRFKNASYHNVQAALEKALDGSGSSVAAEDVTYDNSDSGLTADDVQGAIDELGGKEYAAEDITYDNSDSGLTADDVQGAIDELACRAENIYSASEVEIGKWGNDKLYRKIFAVQALPTGTQNPVTIQTGLTNYEMKRVYGHAETSEVAVPLPFCFPAQTTDTITMTIENNDIIIKAGQDRSAFSGEVVLEYIKTA